MKLVFLDIDGTLTPPGTNEVPQSAQEAIRRARASGHRVFLCTGRNMAMVKPLLPYGFDGVIASAGGYVVCGDEVIYDHPMEEGLLDETMELLHGGRVFRTIEALYETYGDEAVEDTGTKRTPAEEEIVRWRRELAGTLHILPMKAWEKQPVYKMAIMCEREEQLEDAKKRVGDRIDFCVQKIEAHMNIINGDLIPREFSKASGVRRLCEHLHVSAADTVGFGDSVNDLSMLDAVGTSVCMENGEERLKEHCDLICGAVEEDGLYRAFTQLSLL